MTIKDIAKESGYAISTVSRALNNHPDVSEKAKKRIQEIVSAHGFIPNSNAKQLKQQSTNSICILVKGNYNMLFAVIIEQMQLEISKRGYTVALHYLGEDANSATQQGDEVLKAVQLCRESKPLGIIFLGGNVQSFKKYFKNVTVPCALVTAWAEDLGFDNLSSISIDDEKSAETAIDYIIENGHERIGVIGGHYDVSNLSLLRFNGCKKAFEKHGHIFNEHVCYAKAKFNYKSAYKAMNRLLENMPDITAVFAMSDVMAIGAIRAICDRGLRVPQDISVMGFDGIELADYYSPKLTTIKQPEQIMAYEAVNILINSIENGISAKNVLVQSDLIKGESVAKLK